MKVGDTLRTQEDYEAVPVGGTVSLDCEGGWHWVRDEGGFYGSGNLEARSSAAGMAGAERTVLSLPDPAPEQMSPEELHRVLDTVRDGDVIEFEQKGCVVRGAAKTWPALSVSVPIADVRFGDGSLTPGLTSVRVVERARPDWAADDVAMIRTSRNVVWYRQDRHRDEWRRPVSNAIEVMPVSDLVHRYAGEDVEIVARFEQAQP